MVYLIDGETADAPTIELQKKALLFWRSRMDLLTGAQLSVKERERLVDALRPSAQNVNRTTHPPPMSVQLHRGASGRLHQPQTEMLRKFRPAPAPTATQSASSCAPNAAHLQDRRLANGRKANVDVLAVDSDLERDDEDDGSQSDEGRRDEGEADGLVDDLMCSTGLPRGEVELLLHKFRSNEGAHRKGGGVRRDVRHAHNEEERFFVTETPDLPAAQKLGEPPSCDALTPRAQQSQVLETFLPCSGVSTSHLQTNYDAEMATMRARRDARDVQRRTNVNKYLEQHRRRFELPTSLTERNAFVAKYEAEARAKMARERARVEAREAKEREERRQRRLCGVIPNMAIRERIEVAQKQPQLASKASPATVATCAVPQLPHGAMLRQASSELVSPRAGDIAPFVSDDCRLQM